MEAYIYMLFILFILFIYTASQEYYVVYFYILRIFHFVYINIEKSLKQLLTLIFRVVILLPTATNKEENIMYKFVEKLSNELEECGRIPLFEIEVVDVSGTTDFIHCDIYFKGNSIIAERDAVSTAEQRSKYIVNSRVVCDSAYTLDEHLQSLYTKILDDIIGGDLYELASCNA